jgi:MYXO-CTERM domain-containing protein
MQAAGKYEQNGVLLAAGTFAGGLVAPDDYVNAMDPPDAALAGGSPAIDAAAPLANLNDGAPGGPDVGALELGCAAPLFGVRPEGIDEGSASPGCEGGETGETGETSDTGEATGSDETGSADVTGGTGDTGPGSSGGGVPTGGEGPTSGPSGDTSAGDTGTGDGPTEAGEGGCGCRSDETPALFVMLVAIGVGRRRRRR